MVAEAAEQAGIRVRGPGSERAVPFAGRLASPSGSWGSEGPGVARGGTGT